MVLGQRVLEAAEAAEAVALLIICALHGAPVPEAVAVWVFLVKDQTGLEEAGAMLHVEV